MKSRLYVICSLLCMLYACAIVKAQYAFLGSPAITNFSKSDYQAGTQNWAIGQDERGIMYFANNKGILEFDGTQWRILELPNSSSIVRSFSFTKDGRIYVGGQGEFGYFQANKKGKNEYKSLTDLIPTSISFEDIWKIFLLEKSIFFCSEKYIFHLKNNQIKIIAPKTRFENFFQIDQKIYLQDKEKGLFFLEDDQLIAIPQSEVINNNRIAALLAYDANDALLISATQGLFLLNKTGIRPWLLSANALLEKAHFFCAAKITKDIFALGTVQNGLILINKLGEIVLHLNKEKGLQNNTVLSILQDVHDNLWLGLDNGIDFVEINSPFSEIKSETGIAGTGYNSIIHEGKLYLGTNQGLYVTNWPKEEGNASLKRFQQIKNSTGQVWSITPLGKDLIVGHHNGCFLLKNKALKKIGPTEGVWKVMQLNNQPNYAIEGSYTGLALYKKEGESWEFIQKIDGFNESARILEQDEEGHIWVSHSYKGVYKIKLSPDLKSTQELDFYNSEDGFLSDISISVTKIKNQLLFTSPTGIYKYDKATNRMVLDQKMNAFFSNIGSIHRLLEDSIGNVWFSMGDKFGILNVQNKGLFNDLDFTYFNQIQKGLVDGFEHVYAYDKNNIFIGTEQGFIHYKPSYKKNADFIFKTLIRKVTSITSGDSIIYFGNNRQTPSVEKINFPHLMNDFRFDFSVPYFEKIDFVQFRFKLEGYESKWSNWTSNTYKEYTNLAAGDYQFIVQARNAYGKESQEAIYEFTILEAWYVSFYAKIVYFLLALAGLWSMIRFIQNREKEKRRNLQQKQKQELEQKEAAFKKEVEKSEAEIIRLRNEKLQNDINHKNSQLASTTMHLVQKSQILLKIKKDLEHLEKYAIADNKRRIQKISRFIDSDIRLDEDWKLFEHSFDQVHENFFKRLRATYPNLTPKHYKLCGYLRMNLSTKEIAPLLNISVRGVEISRYRLRKKLNLDPNVNLTTFIMEF